MLLRKIDTNNNANHDYIELGIKLLELVENLYLRYISLSDIDVKEHMKRINLTPSLTLSGNLTSKLSF